MADSGALTLVFLASHPSEAARVLERIPAQDAAQFLATVPPRVGAPVVASMLPPAAARVLGMIENREALALLAHAGVQAAVSIIRYVPQPRQLELVQGLPTVISVASKLLLGYSEDTVGAWVDPQIIAIGAEVGASDALARVRDGDETQIDRIHVVDHMQRLVGLVDLHELLRAPQTSSLATLMHKPGVVLSALASIIGAAAQRGWEDSSSLPVVEGSGRLIGVLTKSMLARALVRRRKPAPVDDETTLAALFARGYWNGVSGLATAVVELLPAAKPIKESS